MASAALVASPGASGGRGGLLDAGFAEGGLAVTDLGADEWVGDLAVQPDGKAIVVGTSERAVPDGIQAGFAVARYARDGDLDTSFNGTGTVRTENGAVRAAAVILQRDGRVVAAGNGFRGRGSDFVIARYRSGGDLDTSFGEAGLALVDFERRFDAVVALDQQEDGRIVALGFTTLLSEQDSADFAFVRVDSEGRLDPSFDGDGARRLDLGGLEAPSDVAVQRDGKIVFAGSTASPPAGGRMVVGRLNQDGSLDASFGGDGVAETDRPAPNDFAAGVVLQPDGKILIGAGGEGGLAAARYTPAGEPDQSFGSAGVAAVRVAGGATAVDLALQQNGKVVVLGAAVARGADLPTFALARFLPTGRLDASFGSSSSGVALHRAPVADFPAAVALAPGGSIVAAGTRRDEARRGDFLVARYVGGTCSVPQLRGASETVARTRLARSNCRVGTVTAARSPRVKKGRVLRQRPSPGRQLEDWAKVDVVLSRGGR